MSRRQVSLLIVAGLFGLNVTLIYRAIHDSLDYGTVTFQSLLLFIGIFVALERIIPYRRAWHPSPAEWRRDGIYFALVMGAGATGQALVLVAANYLAAPVWEMPIWGEFFLAVPIGTLGGYWFHRWGHRVSLLWRIHGVHHVPCKVNLANNSVVHGFDVIGSAVFTQLPLLVLGFSEEAMFVTGMVTMMLGYFIHANIDVDLGWVNYVITTPQTHRLHHSLDLQEAGHFSTDLALWDLAFKTFTWTEGKDVKRVGVQRKETFPRTEWILSTLIHPFRTGYRRQLSEGEQLAEA